MEGEEDTVVAAEPEGSGYPEHEHQSCCVASAIPCSIASIQAGSRTALYMCLGYRCPSVFQLNIIMIHQFISSFINSSGRNNFQTTVIHQFDIPIPYDHFSHSSISSQILRGSETEKEYDKTFKVWDDFVEERLEEGMPKEQQKAKCLHCGEKYLCDSKRYGVKNLSSHLSKCKPYLAKHSDGQTKITFEHGDTSKMMAWKFDQKASRKGLGVL
ncbi:hypothetical protein E3N88_15108 [Mikania micrantha]|uniref:BED-type domain-containing protein n=1 Tax=Mikania micrantha TaxID=192012 RepID=A0A5N6NVY2_9ASTR|nr:hypothetical protein E3N88_15108 [Mikania micrantha]